MIIFEKVYWHLDSYSATTRFDFWFSALVSRTFKLMLFKLMQHFSFPKESLVGFTSMPFKIHFMEIDLKRHRCDEADRHSHFRSPSLTRNIFSQSHATQIMNWSTLITCRYDTWKIVCHRKFNSTWIEKIVLKIGIKYARLAVLPFLNFGVLLD